jgi:drug/metabolite transporter (DMT)-like permease
MPVKQVGGKPFLLFFRGLMGFMALVAFFYNIAHISLADAMTFSRTSPMFTALLAFWFLKEKLGVKEVVALIVGFVGIVCIMKPNGLQLELTDILGLLSGVGAALAYTSVKELKKFYDTRVIVLSFMLTGTIGPLLLIAFNDFLNVEFLKASFIIPDLKMWIYIVGLGVSATVAQIYMTKAYGATKAGIVGSVSYANILFSMIIGVMLGDALPDFWGAFGIILVIIGGILVAKEKK